MSLLSVEHGSRSGILRAGGVEFDREKLRVRQAGREVHLGPMELRILEFLMRTPGRVYSRAEIRSAVWGTYSSIDERTVDVHVARMRKALARGTIRTVRGFGYSVNEI
jgi:two-component system phosphate regulon response regulator PhoB